MAFPKYSRPMFVPKGGPDGLGAWLVMLLMRNNGKQYYQKVWFENMNSMNHVLESMKKEYGVKEK